MALHTNINDTYLPEDVSPSNILTTFYESYVLIPNLGPLLYTRLYRELEALVDDFAASLSTFDRLRDYLNKYGELPTSPLLNHTRDDIVMKNPVESVLEKVQGSLATTVEHAVVSGTVRSVATVASKTATDTTREQKDAAYQKILSEFSAGNKVMNSLTSAGLLFSNDLIASRTFIKKSDSQKIEAMVKVLVPTASTPSVWAEKITDKLLSEKNQPLLSKYKSKLLPLIDTRLKGFLKTYRIEDIKKHTIVTESCEWAFLRKEKITLELNKPFFRGPLNVNSVSPNSRLKISDSFETVRTSADYTLSQSGDTLKEYSSITSEIKNQMGTLFDYGSGLGHSMSSQGYSQEDMKSLKRTRVESALREISDRNSAYSLSSVTTSSSVQREYTTKGKDEKFATSELEFEVFTPVHVTHSLEDIGAVWCPRIVNPFGALRHTLDEYYHNVYSDYVLENFVVDPVQPIETFEDVGRVTKSTPDGKKNDKTYSHTVTFTLTPTERDDGYFFGDDIRLDFKQETGWEVDEFESDDYWMRTDSIVRLDSGDVEVNLSYRTDASWWCNDPDWHRVDVSIDKYKYTDAFRQELAQYKHTTEKLNPARKRAVRAQARKYASLKSEELIRKYEKNSEMLREFAFTGLMKKMFRADIGDHRWSYYRGIIERCIDWNKSRFDLEPCEIEGLYETVLSPYHFLNVNALRFFLALNRGAEDIFFDTMKNIVDDEWKELFATVKSYIDEQREAFGSLSEEGRVIDSYDSELVLGRHLEAILSRQEFVER